jgi:hypothetical protein
MNVLPIIEIFTQEKQDKTAIGTSNLDPILYYHPQ